MGEVFLTKGHPETGALDGGIVDDETLYLLVVEQIALTRSDVRIGERLMELQRFGLHPLSVFPIETFLCDFADIDFRIEVGGKGLVMVATYFS